MPVVENTKGVKVAFSTERTLSLYFLIFSCSCLRRVSTTGVLLFVGASELNTRISVNTLSRGLQTPLAETSRRALLSVFVDRYWNVSPVMGKSCGSISTSLHPASTRMLAVRFLKLLIKQNLLNKTKFTLFTLCTINEYHKS